MDKHLEYLHRNYEIPMKELQIIHASVKSVKRLNKIVKYLYTTNYLAWNSEYTVPQ